MPMTAPLLHRCLAPFRRCCVAVLLSLILPGLFCGRILWATPPLPLPDPPASLVTRVGDRSVVLHWDAPTNTSVKGYLVYRAFQPAGPFTRISLASNLVTQLGYADLIVTNNQTYHYLVKATNAAGESAESIHISATPKPFANDDEFLELLQATAFDYFWYEANPANGMIRDRSTTASPSSIAAVGFGLTGIGIAIDHGWITREQGRTRVLNTLRTAWELPQGTQTASIIGYKGWLYHFLDMPKALRTWNCELSSIDTALFLAGAVYAREYFDGSDPGETAIRNLVNQFYDRIDWAWMLNGGTTLSMGWNPPSSFISSRWVGYNEGSILYILAMGARVNPLPGTAWDSWTAGYKWQTYYGYSYVTFPPLFGHQYSQCWLDLRHVADSYMRGKGSTYFENSRRATLAQREYAIANPLHYSQYGALYWGFTACDGPSTSGYNSYAARGAPPGTLDDGTIAPTAPGGSMPFAPEVCLPTLRNFYDKYRAQIWTGYGFRDAFNMRAGWWDPDVLGIDQGPILLMIENHRSRRVWNVLMKAPEIRAGLERAGFKSVTFARPSVRALDAGAGVALTWPAAAGKPYRVEYSGDLERWLFSSSGYLVNSNNLDALTWIDSGPPGTETAPETAPQRFYRVDEWGP